MSGNCDFLGSWERLQAVRSQCPFLGEGREGKLAHATHTFRNCSFCSTQYDIRSNQELINKSTYYLIALQFVPAQAE